LSAATTNRALAAEILAVLHAAGVRTILIPTLKEKESPYADFVCENFTEAVKIILSAG
jgi:hypothetical protein